jgi:hypothetical protein
MGGDYADYFELRSLDEAESTNATGIALAFAGVIGSAFAAFSPTFNIPIKRAGLAEFTSQGQSGLSKVYSVPVGKTLLLTDLVVTNFGGSSEYFSVSAGPSNVCSAPTLKLNSTIVPPNNNTILSFQTGLVFTSGQAVCISTSTGLYISGRGFFYTVAP